MDANMFDGIGKVFCALLVLAFVIGAIVAIFFMYFIPWLCSHII